MIPKSQWKNWKPTAEMIRAAETVFMAMAYTETIRPIVEGYQRAILRDMRPCIAKKWTTGERRMKNETILDPERTYLLEDADFRTYLARCNEEQARAGLHTDSPEFCPLLVAEDLQRKAEHALIDIMEPATGIAFDQIVQSGHALENLEKYLDLTLRMMAGFVKSAPEIMKRVA